MNETMNVVVELVKDVCGRCGGVFAISVEFKNMIKSAGKFQTMYHCPYCGVKWGYGETEEDRLKKRISELDAMVALEVAMRDDALNRRREAELERDHFRKSRDGIKGALAKVKKRVGNGVCPCCNRSFKDLSQHMRQEHAGYAGSQAEDSA